MIKTLVEHVGLAGKDLTVTYSVWDESEDIKAEPHVKLGTFNKQFQYEEGTGLEEVLRVIRDHAAKLDEKSRGIVSLHRAIARSLRNSPEA